MTCRNQACFFFTARQSAGFPAQELLGLSRIAPSHLNPGPAYTPAQDPQYERERCERLHEFLQRPTLIPTPERRPFPTPCRARKIRSTALPWLPCTLTLEVPVVHFTIADLLALKEGSIVETACHHTSDVPLRVNQLLIGWTEFEVIEDHLAVRITEQI